MLLKHTLFLRNVLIGSIIVVMFFSINLNVKAEQNDIGWLDTTIRTLVTNVDEMKNLKISGFIQAQYMSAARDGMASTLSGNFPDDAHNIFKIRRGRLKLNYTSGIANYVIQFNGTESTFQLLDAYVELKEPYLKTFSLRAGIFKPNIDQELLYGSDLRYCNESARIVQKFFPAEYDVGAQLMIKHPKVPVSLTAGILNGTTIAPENDNRKNFTARLLYDDKFNKEKVRVLVGFATYQGGVYQATPDVYTMQDNVFALDNNPENQGKQGKRNYYVAETTLEFKSPIGKTWFNGEYWFGEQTGSAMSVNSPGSARPTGASYLRPFQSFFGLLAHEIVNTNTALAVKFDYFDPNTKVSGNDIGISEHTGVADITYTTLSCGIIFTPTKHLRFSAWYDIPTNETTQWVTGYTENRKENLFTLRMQVRF